MSIHQVFIESADKVFDILFNESLAGFYITDNQGKFLDTNSRGLEMLGYAYDEFLQLCVPQILDPDFLRENPIEPYEIKKGVASSIETRILRKDGRRMDVFVTAYRLDEDRVLSVIRNIDQHTAKINHFENIVNTANEGVWSMSADHSTTYVNIRMAEMLGYTPVEMLGEKIEKFIAPDDLKNHERDILARYEGKDGTYERCLLRKDGSIIWTKVNAIALMDQDNKFIGSHALLTDITVEKRNEQVMQARLHLMQFAVNHSLDEILQTTLDEAEALTDSQIGFYHFIDNDQETIHLQAWSTRTVNELCNVDKDLFFRHYSVSKAGVWVDCIHTRAPVIHNDYASLTHRKGMPEGHANVIRELVVPVIRGEKIMALLGVGNKHQNYTDQDVEIISRFADLAWSITESKRIEMALKDSEEKYYLIDVASQDMIYSMDLQGRFTHANKSLCDKLDLHADQIIGKNVAELGFSQTQSDNWGNLYKKVIQTDSTITSEILFPDQRNGSEWHEVVLNPIHGTNGTIIGIAGTTRNINTRKKAEEKIQEQLEELNRWHTLTLGREKRILELKKEVNELMTELNKPVRYGSVEDEVHD